MSDDTLQKPDSDTFDEDESDDSSLSSDERVADEDEDNTSREDVFPSMIPHMEAFVAATNTNQPDLLREFLVHRKQHR